MLKTSHGIEVAQKTIADAVRASSIEQAKEFAAKVGGNTSIQTFVDRQSLWKLGGAMEMEVKEQTETSYVFNVTRCKYAEMYLETGLGEIGHLLSCQRDATFCEGYDKRMRLAALIAADVSGYLRLMGRDEYGTLGRRTARVRRAS